VYEINPFFSRSRFIFWLCFFCAPIFLVGQDQQRIDSIETVLEERTGIDRYEPLVELTREYFNADYAKAIRYMEEAHTIVVANGDSVKIVYTGRIIGQLYNRMDRPKEALEILLKSLPIAERNNHRNERKTILNNLALAYTILAEYDKALDINFKTLVLREEDDDKEINVSLNNIGLVYFKLRNYPKALEYYERALKLVEESPDRSFLDRQLINIGLCYNQMQNYSEALKYFQRAFDACQNNCHEQVKIEGEFGLGVAQFGLNNFDEAEKHFRLSKKTAETIHNNRFQVENLVYLAKIAIAKKESDNARSSLLEAESLADSAGYKQLLIDTYRQFSILYNQLKDFENASTYQMKYIHLKDSLISEELVKNVAKIQTNFEERENIATIKLKEDALIRQRNLNLAIGVIALLTALLGFVLYRSNVVTRKVNSALSDAKGIIETQNIRLQNINRELDGKVKEKTADLLKANDELDRANKALSHVNDELDNFIYKTSHDIRGPLASLKGICSVALMDVKDPLALDYLNKLDVSSGRLNVILTRLLIVNQINNAIVGRELIDFNSIIDDVILLEKKKGLPARFEIKRELQQGIELQSDRDLVRIILENLIDNAIKFHNDSERVQPFVFIRIGSGENGVIVSVIDNGIGIAEAKPDKIFQMFSRASERSGTGGIGLYLSKLATEKLGGQIHLRTTPEGYTEFYVVFPERVPVA
jgi:signal transduction histidine kinase